MKVTCLLPVVALLAAVTCEPVPVKRGVLLKKDEDCVTNATTSSVEVDPVASTSSGRVTRGYGGFYPPYGTGSWGAPTGSVTSSSAASISASFSDRPRNGTISTSSTEGSPATGSGSTSTTLTVITITASSSGSDASFSILPVTNATSSSVKPTGYVPPPYGYFPVSPGVDSSSTEVSPATGTEPAYPTPCNETSAWNTAPTAPLSTAPLSTAPLSTTPLSTGTTTITLPLTLTTTLTASTITISSSNSTEISPATGSNVTSSAFGTGTSASPISPITTTGGSSGFPSGTGKPTGYWSIPPYGAFPPFPISSRPRSGYQTLSGTGIAPCSTPIAPVNGTNSTSSLPGPTGVSSSPVLTRKITISTGTTYTITVPGVTAPTGNATSSTEGSPAASSSNSTSSGALTTITSQSTTTGTTTFTVPGITTRIVVETSFLNITVTLSATGGSSSSTEGSPVSPSASSIPLSTGVTTGSPSGPVPYPYLPFTPSAPLSTGVSSSSTEGSPVDSSASSSSIPLSTGVTSSSTEGSPIGSSNTTSSFPGTGTSPTPYLTFTPSGIISGSSSSEVDAATDSVSFTTSAFTTITITPRTTLTSPAATNTPFTPSTAARLPGGYGGPPPGYGEGYQPEGQGSFGGWGRVVGNW